MGQVIPLHPTKADDDFFVEAIGRFVGVTCDITDFYGERIGGYTLLTPADARRMAGELLAAALKAERE